jgi:hypothetical protein
MFNWNVSFWQVQFATLFFDKFNCNVVNFETVIDWKYIVIKLKKYSEEILEFVAKKILR